MTTYETSYYTIVRTDEDMYSVVQRTYPEIIEPGTSCLHVVDLSKGEYVELSDARELMAKLADKTNLVAVDFMNNAVIAGLYHGMCYASLIVFPTGKLKPVGIRSTTMDLPIAAAKVFEGCLAAKYVPFTKKHDEGSLSDSDSE